MSKPPKFKEGNVVSVHFTDPSAIGYNGSQHIVVSVAWFEPWNDWRYCIRSLNGPSCIFAKESELRFVSDRHWEPWQLGPCTIEIGD